MYTKGLDLEQPQAAEKAERGLESSTLVIAKGSGSVFNTDRNLRASEVGPETPGRGESVMGP